MQIKAPLRQPCCPPAADDARITDGAGPVYDEFHEGFRNWTARYLAAEPGTDLAVWETDGEQAAAERRAQLAKLIQSDPERALKAQVPWAIRERLPEKVQRQLEERVSGRGSIGTVFTTPEPGQGKAGMFRPVRMGNKDYQAFVYGRRLKQIAQGDIPMHGIALDGKLALHHSPMRILEPGEKIPTHAKIGNPDLRCPVSGRPSGRAAAADIGGTLYFVCAAGHLMSLEGQFLAQEDGSTGSSGGDVAASSWTQGSKSVLYINVKFADGTASHSASAFNTWAPYCNEFMQENSYGTMTVTHTVTPLLTLPQTEAYYKAIGDSSWNATNAVINDARIVAANAGYDRTNYTLDAVCWVGGPGSYAGIALIYISGGVYDRRVGLKNIAANMHEFGHQWGLSHANFWATSPESVIGPGSNAEYGDVFDTMGSVYTKGYHFNACHKNKLDWLPSAQVKSVTSSGTYRITAFDQPVLNTSQFYALSIPKTGDSFNRVYWVDFRQQQTNNPWLMNGAELHWAPWTNSKGTHLLDTTPGSADGKNDAALVVGRTFSDTAAGIHITPIGKGGTSPESLDVVIKLGNFPGNRAPTLSLSGPAATGTGTVNTFTATASDADGDTLAYAWDFGDRTFGPNSAVATKSWSAANEYVVRCTVSDMKGGVASDSIVVTAGSPARYRIGGKVLDDAGQPVQGVRVYVSSTQMTYTNSDGSYDLVGLSAGSYTVGAALYPYSLTANFANPVVVGPNATGKDFTAVGQTFPVSGKVTDETVPVSGVTVSSGTRSASTDANGNFTLNLPNGSHTLNASKSGYTFTTNGWSNPVLVADAAVAGRNFCTPLCTLSGRILDGATGVAGAVVSDGTRTATTNGSGNYTLPHVPFGSRTLTATKPGYALNPSGWSNPLNVNTESKTNINFVRPLFSLSGQISGVPTSGTLPTVHVGDGLHSALCTTTGNGNNKKVVYSLNVPGGAWNLFADLNGYTISPSSFTNPLNVSGPASGLNFNATSTTTYKISGQVTLSGAGVAGVTVSTGSRLCTTDSIGNYALTGVSNGSYTLTPSKAGSTFTPATRSVSVSGAHVTGQNFAVNTGNSAPTNISLTNSSVAENAASGTTVGTLASTDPDAGNTFTYSLVSGSGSADNAAFSIGGSTLKTAAVFDYETRSSCTIRIRTTDQGGLFFEKAFTVSIANVNEPPGIFSEPTATPNPASLGE